MVAARHPSAIFVVFVLGLLGLAGLMGACGSDPDQTARTADTAAVDTTNIGPADTGGVAPVDTSAGTPDADVSENSGDADAADSATADSATGDSAAADTSTGPCDGFGCACNANEDCLEQLCIESADGAVCTKPCIADCPEGWDCLTSTAFGPDPISICVPRHVRLCRPCNDGDDCQAASDAYPAHCLPSANPDDGSFCATSCATRLCPPGYSCLDEDVASGGSAKVCVPDTGMCTCRDSWADLGLGTTCHLTNGYGSCAGTRACEAGGLSACDAPQALLEICDGKDDDCDGVTDNVPADPCTIQNEFGFCAGTRGCDESGPTCDGAAPQPETCDGVDNNCNGSIDEFSCNDGLICTTDTCLGAGDCQHSVNTGFCSINNQCFVAGAPNPGNACQVCDPNKSTSGWSAASNTCTINGQCYQSGAVNTASPCQICQPSTSTTGWTQASNTCNIGGTCYAAGAGKPGQPCLQCRPEVSLSGWTVAGVNTFCNDGNACSTDDHCDAAGQCVGDTSCNDGIACTQDVCNSQTGCNNSAVTSGWCRIGAQCYTNNTTHPSQVCKRCNASVNQTNWSNQPTSVSCEDGSACTVGDHCSGGSCVSGGGCSDGLSCTTDTCNAWGCSYPTAPGKCKINDACYSNGATKPGNVCYKCNSASPSGWSYNNGASCIDGNSCTSSDTCSSGVCAGSPIQDGYENNGSIGSAYNLGSVDDKNDADEMKSFTANLYPSGDTDWFKFKDNDTNNFAQPNPRVALVGIPASSNYTLCAYYQCDDVGDGQAVDCKQGTDASDGTRPGCCSIHAGSAAELVHFKPECDNGTFTSPADDDTGTVYVRVFKESGSSTCDNYTLKWGDD